jgi:tRNA modification GTPase
VVLACITPETAATTLATLEHYGQTSIVRVGMKGDLVSTRYEQEPDVTVSAVTRMGLDELLVRIGRVLGTTSGARYEERPALTRARHRVLISEARNEVAAFIRAWEDQALPAPIAATHIHAAAAVLGEMVGDIHVDDILDVVFSSFCVGK